MLVLFLIAVALSASQPGQNQGKAGSAATPAAQQNNSTPKTTAGIENNGTPPSKAASKNEQQTTYQDAKPWMSHGEYVMAGLTLIYVVATIFYAVTSLRTLKAIEGQSKQTDELIVATKKNADAAKASAEAIIASERAWVMVELDSTGLFVSDGRYQTAKLSLSVVYNNVGRTPAWITEGSIYFELVDIIPSTPDFDVSGWTVQPRWLSDKHTEERELDWEGYQNANGSAKNRIVYGIIKYQDILGSHRTTIFGYEFDLEDKPRRITRPGTYNKNT
jgi:hypothetical protein